MKQRGFCLADVDKILNGRENCAKCKTDAAIFSNLKVMVPYIPMPSFDIKDGTKSIGMWDSWIQQQQIRDAAVHQTRGRRIRWNCPQAE